MDDRRRPNRVLRPDGRFINVPLHRGQLMVCATGCCCGRVERGFAPVPTDLYHQEWEGRKLRNKVHLTQAGCLGPCPLANVTMLFFDGRFIGFQAVDDPKIITAIFDYIEAMMAVSPEESLLIPLPKLLEDRTFDYFTWSSLASAPHSETPVEIDALAGDGDGILFLSQADTDLLIVSHILPDLPTEFPSVLLDSLNRFRNEGEFADFLARTLPQVRVVVARLHGGRAGFRLGFDRLVDSCRALGKDFICVSGTADLDSELTAVSTVPLPVIFDTYTYLAMSGRDNIAHLFCYLADNLMMGGFGYELPQKQPRHGIYYDGKQLTQSQWLQTIYQPKQATIAFLFYRSHWLTGNTRFVDALVEVTEAQGLNALPVFTYSLKDITEENGRPICFDLLHHPDTGLCLPDILISTMSFAMGKINMEGATQAGWNVDVLQTLGLPVLQAITSGMEVDQWSLSARGLSPLDTAMNVALPEFDGRIATVPISFKGPATLAETNLQTSISEYIPIPERINRVVGLAKRLIALQNKDNSEKRITIILTNDPGRAAKIGNAVGLDTPASLIHLLHALDEAGYTVGDIPADGDTLIHTLIDRCSYDVEYLTEAQIGLAEGVDIATYEAWFAQFPDKNKQQMSARWHEPADEVFHYNDALKFAGLQLGNLFLALQPPRGYGVDPDAVYHMPDLPPTHHYAAFYRWLRETWDADAIVHMGKHGTLEWLPGKGVGPAQDCYPDLFLQDLPLIYPFIINDPGEGMQAKRRTHAVIIDHLMPPMTSAETYGDLEELQQLVDQYYQLEALDPSKLPMLQRQIWEVMEKANLGDDLAILGQQTHGDHTHEWDDTETEDGTPVTLAEMTGKDFAHLMEDLDGYLCEIGSLQIRDGLYTLGHRIEGEQLVDLLFALTRLPNLDVPSLREVVTAVFEFDLNDLLDNPGKKLSPEKVTEGLFTHADVIAKVDDTCRHILAASLTKQAQAAEFANSTAVQLVLNFVDTVLLPGLISSREQEIGHILLGLNGRYVPAGPSGSPTRGMAHILPTGRNFYAVDPRGIPNQTAWRVGQALADELLAKYLREEGAYPQRVGLTVWGTSAMRTHGDDLAQCFALLGVRPTYQKENRRIVGVEPISLTELGRPRIDVLMRISGFFVMLSLI